MSTLQNLEDMTSRYERSVSLAEEYLSSRGLTIEDAATYRLGVVSDDSPESAPYLGRLSIPYLTPAGVRDIRFRALDGREPKYMSRPGAHGLMFNVGALWQDNDTIAICEGEMDAIVMDLFSGIPAVGIPGAQAWKKHFTKLFADYDRVLVIGDGDTAGREFARSIVSKIEQAIPIYMDDGMDVNDLYLNRGVEGVEGLVA